MNRISMSKKFAVVVSTLTLSFGGFAQGTLIGESLETATMRETKADERAKLAREKAEEKECISLQKEVKKAKGDFISACKADENASECSERMRDCTSARDGENPFSVMGPLLGVPAISGFGGATGGKCSKYTQDKLDSTIDKAKSGLERKKEKELDAKRKQVEDEEKFAETNAEKQKEFIEQQEAREKEVFEAKEKSRNMKKTFDDQVREYEAKMRQLDDEIFSTQKAQQILIQKRRIDIANYKGMMAAAKMKCNKEVKDAMASMNPNYARTGSFSGAQAKRKEIQDLYLACLDQHTSKRITDAEQFKVDMERFDRSIANKQAELKALQQSADSMKAMYNQALQDEATMQQKQEDAFMKNQMAKWQQINTLGQNMLSKRMNNMKAIQEATGDVSQASNELMDLQSQEAAADGRSVGEVRRDFLKSMESSLSAYEALNCDTVLRVSTGKEARKEVGGKGSE